MKSEYYTVTTIKAILVLLLLTLVIAIFLVLLDIEDRIVKRRMKKRMMRYNIETLEAMR